jgi:hypothetical protein
MKYNLLFAGLAIVMMLPLHSSAQRFNFEPSSVVPAATGHVKITKDRNQNFNLQIELVNLADVGLLQTGMNTYVVWMLANQDSAKNIGQLKSGKNLFSKKSKASFETISVDKPRRIFITAESDGKIDKPKGVVVISTGNF